MDSVETGSENPANDVSYETESDSSQQQDLGSIPDDGQNISGGEEITPQDEQPPQESEADIMSASPESGQQPPEETETTNEINSKPPPDLPDLPEGEPAELKDEQRYLEDQMLDGTGLSSKDMQE